MRVVAGHVAEIAGEADARSGRRPVRRRRSLLLTLEDVEGRCGQGEASPLPTYSPDTLEGCRQALKAACARLPREVDVEGPVAASVLTLVEEIDASVPAARMAFESALLDLAGKTLGAAVSVLLGRWDPGRAVPLAVLLPYPDPVPTLVEHLDHGVTSFKLKIGRAGRFAEELEVVRRVRSVGGDRIGLRLDVNEGWSPLEAVDYLARLADFAPEFVEQPVPRGFLAALPVAPVAIAADESLQSPVEAAAILASRSCKVLVLKPTILGGLMRCLDLARAASRAGLGVVISHAFEGPVALAAACELALAVEPRPLACGLAPHGGLDAWPRLVVPQLSPATVVATWNAGLGLSKVVP